MLHSLRVVRRIWLGILALTVSIGAADVPAAAERGGRGELPRSERSLGRHRRPACKPLGEIRGRTATGLRTSLVAPPLAAALDAPVASWTRRANDPAHTAFFVQNTGAAPAQVEWVSLNGRRVFGSLSDIQAEIDAIPPEGDGSAATRVFRFVMLNRRHAFQLTTAFEWFLSPTLFFNSSGVAHCGEAAEEINMLATDRGFPAREWGLSGHVVAEVQVGGRWQMYDADWGVYFLTRDGEGVASVEELEADPTLITDPVLRLETPGYDPYGDPIYARVFTTAADNWIRRTTPRATRPPRPLVVMLPRGGSLRVPGHFASAPLDYNGLPITADWSNLVLRLPAGASGQIGNPFIVRTLRGSGSVSLAGQVFEIGSAEMQDFIDARSDPLETLELLEARTAVDVVYLLNPLRWSLGSVNTLALRTADAASLKVSMKPSGDPSRDWDGDGIPDDGDASGIVGDAPCAHADSSGCDDNCVADANVRQLDADADGSGNRCDGDFDQDELVTAADAVVLDACAAGGAPADDPSCAESDLDENGRVDAFDKALLDWAPPTVSCGFGVELVPTLALLAACRRRRGAEAGG